LRSWGDQAGDNAVENAFGNFLAIVIEHGRVGHQVADVANQQQGATMEFECGAIAAGVFTVCVEPAGHGFAVLHQRLRQVTLHQAQPVAIHLYLVVGVDGCDGVFAVDDGR